MAPSESFDPHTWKKRDSASAARPVAAVEPAVAGFVEATVSVGKHRWWLGPALSAAIVAGGAFAAYETRSEAPAAQAAASAQ